MRRQSTTRAASARAPAQLRAARSTSTCAAKAARLVDPVGGLGRKSSTRREDEVEVNHVTGVTRGREGRSRGKRRRPMPRLRRAKSPTKAATARATWARSAARPCDSPFTSAGAGACWARARGRGEIRQWGDTRARGVLARRAAAVGAVLGEGEVVDAGLEGARGRDEIGGEAARCVTSVVGLRRELARARGRGGAGYWGWPTGATGKRTACRDGRRRTSRARGRRRGGAGRDRLRRARRQVRVCWRHDLWARASGVGGAAQLEGEMQLATWVARGRMGSPLGGRRRQTPRAAGARTWP